MKLYFALGILATAALFSGCASLKNNLTLETVGPAPNQTGIGNSRNGALIVNSAYKVNADFNERDPMRPEYSDYTIFSDDGKLLLRVHNNNGTILQEPRIVQLPAGKYDVRARANGFGFVTVPVIIAPHENTILYFEGGSPWLDDSTFNPTNVVRLPDGKIIGWKAATNL